LVDTIPTNIFRCDGCNTVAIRPARATAERELV
jgi:hypothetical protein